MKFSTALVLLIFLSTSGNCQIQEVAKTQRNRMAAKHCAQQMMWDSACYYYRNVTASDKYSNPFDHLSYSRCCLKTGDTTLFKNLLRKSVEGGIDTQSIHSFFRTATAPEAGRVAAFLAEDFASIHSLFRQRHDSVLVAQLTSMGELDQLARSPLERMIRADRAAPKTDSNYHYLNLVARFGDSINYVRLMRLLEAGGFPGYHQCGAAATESLVQVLLHLDGRYVDWPRMMKILQKAVLDGEIDPDQVATITDRHYLRLAEKPCYYYGRLRWGTEFPLCDCKNVDALRQAIGIESLQSEYSRISRPVPECYNGN